MTEKDYYEILGVDGKATSKQIRDAYRKLALKYHPDRNRGNPQASARMKEINEAYAVLSHPGKKSEYDSMRAHFGSSAYSRFRQTYTEQDIFRGSDVGQIFEEISKAFGFRGFDDVFREFYGPGFRAFESRKPGFFGRSFIFSSFPRSYQDSRQGFSIGGNLGKLIKYALRKKWGIELPERGGDRHDIISISPALARAGGKIRYLCRKKSKELIVTIPTGIKAGQQIRLRGMGDAGKGGAEPGDLYVRIRIKEPVRERIRKIWRRLRS